MAIIDAVTITNPYLLGNYAPVTDEITVADLQVRGQIPEVLSGRYLRTGPNPLGAPPEPYHWFSGAGMVHGIELGNGRASSYRNRWVGTSAITDELGRSATPGPAQPMYDASNTNILAFAGKILSFTEGCYPYELSPELDTVRRFDFGGVLPHGMTAHPKLDPLTGELHAFSYWFDSPCLIYHVVDASGRLTKTIPIELPRSVSMHDFAITRTHVLFFDQPYVFDLDIAMRSGFPFRWSPEFGARVGVLPRSATSGDEIRWIETDPCYCFHPMNAYDVDESTIVAHIPRIDNLWGTAAPEPDRTTLERWTIDLAAGKVTQDLLDDEDQEFCRINESLIGSQHQFGYTMSTSGGVYGGTRLFKHNFGAASRAVREFGPGQHPGEFVFVADPERSSREDGGWMMGLVYDEAVDGSELVMFDAEEFVAPPVAAVTMPRRVPFGFHGNWIPTSA